MRRTILAAIVALSGWSCVSAPPPAPPPPSTVKIAVTNLEFVPPDASARVGDTVEWTNNDVFAHTASAMNGEWRVELPPKQKGTLVLKTPGTFEYDCEYHPNMKGRLIVKP